MTCLSKTNLPDFAIEACNLSKTYREKSKNTVKQALKGIDLKIKRGSMFGLLGPNGAGKSTFINILGGVVKKTSGQASIWGYDINQSARLSRAHIGIVPQEINMDVFFSPYETLEIQASYYGVPKQNRHTDEILEILGLADKRNAYVRHLSGGMKRRLLIAKALVHTPPVVILDEPTAGVDIELREQLWTYIRKLNSQGTTIVLTTHYLEEAEELCDEIAIIHEGNLMTSAPKKDLIAQIDSKTLIIYPATPLQTIPPELLKFNTELKKDGSLVLHYRKDQNQIRDVMASLVQCNIDIKDFQIQEAGLKDVFLQMTYHASK